jgi:hypothetical protein
MLLKMAVFWVVMLCSLIEGKGGFGGVFCLHHQGDHRSEYVIIAVMIEATSTSETKVNFYQTTRCYNPEDSHLHTHRRENIKSYMKMLLLLLSIMP